MSRVYPLAAEVRKQDSPVRLFFQERFPHLKPVAEEFRQQLAGQPTLTPPTTVKPVPFSAIGMAVDYRLRQNSCEAYAVASAAGDDATGGVTGKADKRVPARGAGDEAGERRGGEARAWPDPEGPRDTAVARGP